MPNVSEHVLYVCAWVYREFVLTMFFWTQGSSDHTECTEAQWLKSIALCV
eukprot:m.1454366 g.1454366  ORF g.1454366 m.1454366 type:complete len:50 (+) comp25119_c0_seq12:5203-5352(+)